METGRHLQKLLGRCMNCPYVYPRLLWANFIQSTVEERHHQQSQLTHILDIPMVSNSYSKDRTLICHNQFCPRV